MLLLSSCSSYKGITKKNYKSLSEKLESSPVFSKIFTGFALYDPVENVFLAEKAADKYYTPASNTKIFTFFTANRILGDSLPLLAYLEKGDSLIFWGTGNPLFLHPDFEVGSEAFEFLKQSDKQLYYYDGHYLNNRFGPGWAWGDYAYAYQVEKSSFPMYGNAIRFEKAKDGNLYISPSIASSWTEMVEEGPRISRVEHENIFKINLNRLNNRDLSAEVPFKSSGNVIVQMLADTLKREVRYYEASIDSSLSRNSMKISIAMPDTLMRRFMQQSDNFIAEQLMLMCSYQLFSICDTEQAINYARDSLLSDLPDRPVWRDGSGLSRYNLFTPRSIVKLLHKISQEIPEERLFTTFPIGGVAGTIKSWYGAEEPYIFAKTGTLSNKHCLSGFIKTKSGRTLIFSFMNNNYINGSTEVKEAMQNVLEWIRDEL